MATNKDKQEAPKEQINHRTESSDNQNDPVRPESLKIETDMEPDEFLAPNADTDQPIEGEVLNDAVLRGEGHAADKAKNLPSKDNNKSNTEREMDAEKT